MITWSIRISCYIVKWLTSLTFCWKLFLPESLIFAINFRFKFHHEIDKEKSYFTQPFNQTTWKYVWLYSHIELCNPKQKQKIFNCYRIIEIAGGREVFSQSRGKVAARKPKFLVASNTVNNETTTTDNKLSVKKNTKSPNRQSVWELRSR